MPPHIPGLDLDLTLILALGGLWLAGLILGLRWVKPPDPARDDYAEPDTPPHERSSHDG
jgi:hypothetical protein